MTQIPSEKSIYLPAEDSKTGIILLHAYTGSPKDVHLLARKLNREGYGVLCPLFEGHWTANIEDLLAVDPDQWLDNAKDAVAWMKNQGYKNILVFGLSMGGVMATSLLSDSTNHLLGGGVFNSPVLTKRPIDVSKAFMAYAKHLYREKNELALFYEREQDILKQHFTQIEKLELLKQSLARELATIELPIYIAQSGEDELIEAGDVFELQEALEKARIDFHWFEENTHVITVNRQRSAFEESVLNFIREVTDLNQYSY